MDRWRGIGSWIMKKILMPLAAVAVAFGAWADTETVGDYTWTYQINGDTAEIYNNGSKAISPEPTGTVTIPSTLGGKPVTSIGSSAFSGCSSTLGGKPVTSIGSSAFSGCSGLTSVTIPNSVRSIWGYAFYNCSGLESVTIGNGVTSIGNYAFQNCSGLTSVTIPDGVTSIGMRAFRSCSGLTSVTIPDSVTSIGDSAFSGCGGLTSVTIPQRVCSTRLSSVFSSAYQSLTNVVISGSVTSIGSSAFSGCSGLTSVTIPNSVTSIGNYAFSGCSGLTDMTIPSSVTSMGEAAFSGCSGLTSVTIPGSVTYIKKDAFSGCSGLTSVTILSSVTSIGEAAFSGCSGLTSVTIPGSVTWIDYDAFSGCSGLTSVHITDLKTWCGILFRESSSNPLYYAHDLYLNGEKVTTLTIPDSVTSIRDYAFRHCSGLTNVTIPDSVTSIGDYAFDGCSCLTNVAVGSGIKEVGTAAFRSCGRLKSVQISDLSAWASIKFSTTYYPEFWGASNPLCYAQYLYQNGILVTNLSMAVGIDEIGDLAFCNCKGLQGTLIIPTGVTRIGEEAFAGSSVTNVIIPDSVNRIGYGAFGDIDARCQESVYDYDISEAVTLKKVDGWVVDCSKLTTNELVLAGIRGIARAAFSYSSITNVVIAEGVHGIGGFENCSRLEHVTIPNSATDIGDNAFYNCRKLTSVTIPDGVTSIGNCAFRDCSGLTDMTIPSSVTSIGDYAFDGCSGLAFRGHSGLIGELTISDGVTHIGLNAFSGCTNLTSVTVSPLWCSSKTLEDIGASAITNVFIPDGVTSIGQYAFSGCSRLTSVTIPDSVTSIGSYAFSNCSGLTSVVIGNGVTSIGNSAFYGCSGLTSVHITDLAKWCGISFGSTEANPLYYAHDLCLNGEKVTTLTIPDSVTSIGGSAFYNCSSLTSVTIPNSVTNIEYSAFDQCNKLRNVTIPQYVCTNGLKFSFRAYDSIVNVTINEGVTSIGDYAFSYCSGLTSVTIPNSVTSIGEGAFYGCRCLTSVTIPSGVTSIGSYAFYDCGRLTSVTIPSGVTSIGQWSFGDCYDLTSVTIPSGMTSIGDRAFYNCRMLTSVTIPDSVTSIEDYAFYNCRGLTNVTMSGDCPSMGSRSFDSVNSSCVVHLPKGNSTYDVSDGKWQGMTVEYYAPVFTVTLDANGGTVSGAATVSFPVEYGKYTSQAGANRTVSRSGYTLRGWYDAKSGGNMVFDARGYAVNGVYWNGAYSPSVSSATWKGAGNVIAYAQWVATPPYRIVTFDANGGALGNASCNCVVEQGKYTSQAGASVMKATRQHGVQRAGLCRERHLLEWGLRPKQVLRDVEVRGERDSVRTLGAEQVYGDAQRERRDGERGGDRFLPGRVRQVHEPGGCEQDGFAFGLHSPRMVRREERREHGVRRTRIRRERRVLERCVFAERVLRDVERRGQRNRVCAVGGDAAVQDRDL